jgi:hypothetical protein
MLLTGATAPVAAPASRTLQLNNLTVRHNDELIDYHFICHQSQLKFTVGRDQLYCC